MKPQVLIVDDSLTVRMDLRAVLHEAGFVVTACDTKASAQKALRNKSYSLVILDVLLPDGSGIELLKEIRGSAESAQTPVIMLSTEAEVKHRIRGLTMGANQYVAKPYDSTYVARCARLLITNAGGAPSSSGSADLSFAGKKILVVDDSPTYLEALADLLRQDSHEVVLATSGEEALDLLAVELVDAIILDLLMPGIGGLETCRRIRSNPAQQDIPVMMLTGRDDREARSQGLAAGVDEFVLKSPELEPLKLRLRALLRRKRGDADARNTEDRPSSPGGGMWGRTADVPRNSLLYRVVTESGLSNVIGPTTITRACKRVGIDAKTMSPADLKRALPTIRETLRLFLPPEETDLRMLAISNLVKDVP